MSALTNERIDLANPLRCDYSRFFMKQTRHTIICKILFGIVLAVHLPVRAGMSGVENFDYSSPKQLASAWSAVAGSPVVGLKTNRYFTDQHAMSLTYSASASRMTNAVKLTFAADQDWSSYDSFEMTYGGAGWEARSTNSSDAILIQLQDVHGTVLRSWQIPGGTRKTPLTTAMLNLAPEFAAANPISRERLESVRSIVLGVVASAPGHAGSVYFDQISVGNNRNLAINPGFQDLNHDGKFGDGWDASGQVSFKSDSGTGHSGTVRFDGGTKGNAGEVRGSSIAANPGVLYRLTVTGAFAAHWHALTQFGLQFIAADHVTILANDDQRIYPPNPGITTDRNYSMTATAPAGTVFMRPVIRFADAAGTGSSRSATFNNVSLTIETNQVLSILGSSVANGWKASGYYDNLFLNGSVAGSYGAHLTTELAADHWRVVSQSIPGNTTPDVIGRFYRDEVPVGADAVFIGLSLGNEGLARAKNPGAICHQYYSGITNIVALARANNIMPVIGGNYPKDTYTPDEYTRLNNMDIRINALDVPSVNFLGATDDGKGHWIHNSFINLTAGDTIHPNEAGQYEMFLTIVPSVFDALKAGKPTPQWGNRDRCLRIRADASQPAPLSFTPSLIMHSFTLSFRVRSADTGTVASIVLPAGKSGATIELTSAGIAYVGLNGQVVNSGVRCTNDTWHDVVVAHQYARGLTLFYVDGKLSARVSERMTPVGFVLGGSGLASSRPGSPGSADYQNWFVHRSFLNADEVRAQLQGVLQQASLEMYAPLDDATFSRGAAVDNRAQSFSTVYVNGPTANYASESAKPNVEQ